MRTHGGNSVSVPCGVLVVGGSGCTDEQRAVAVSSGCHVTVYHDTEHGVRILAQRRSAGGEACAADIQVHYSLVS